MDHHIVHDLPFIAGVTCSRPSVVEGSNLKMLCRYVPDLSDDELAGVDYKVVACAPYMTGKVSVRRHKASDAELGRTDVKGKGGKREAVAGRMFQVALNTVSERSGR
jgi:hypothetical protein